MKQRKLSAGQPRAALIASYGYGAALAAPAASGQGSARRAGQAG